ncbi:MAG TPA: sigma 54-interacting transcriptional regulator [Acidiferrobacter sp.]|nr:sigma 54-interacting transcriptional regulator [Acidiferrobacter sp.]
MNPALAPELQSLIDIQENPFVLIDAQYRIVAANRAYCITYGFDKDEVVGKTCYEVSHHSQVPCHQNGEDCPHQEVFRTGQSHEVIHTHFDRHNRPEYARIKGHPVQGSGARRYLGEAIFHIARSDELDCDDMRMVGKSPAFLACLDHLTRGAESDAPILLLGESGVGKEIAAQYIHRRSTRANKPFIAVNCASIAETMFEDELFGHERGAFTGCIGRKQGLFELADGGTLLLDEVGEIPSNIQTKLLRVLETGEFRRLGGTDTLSANVRLVSATNRDLLEMTETNQFRLDLYYRIAGIDIRLPNLKARRSDIPALVETILTRITQTGAPRCKLTDEALDKLMNHSFPGNVRELRNILLKAVAMSSHGIISVEHIHLGSSPSIRNHPNPHAASSRPDNDRPFANPALGTAGLSMAEIEARHIGELLAAHNGHRRNVADLLGISERTLYRKLRLYRLA